MNESLEARMHKMMSKYLNVMNIWYLFVIAVLKEKYPKDIIINDILWDIPVLPRLIPLESSIKSNAEKAETSQENLKNNISNENNSSNN